MNEKLRANKQIVVRLDDSGLSAILFALRMYPSAKGKSAHDKYTGVEPNHVKKLKQTLPGAFQKLQLCN